MKTFKAGGAGPKAPSAEAVGHVVDTSRSLARISYDAGIRLLPELHQARWAERYGELMRDRRKAWEAGDMAKVEALRQAILDHHKSRYDTTETRARIEAQYQCDLAAEGDGADQGSPHR